uniref:Uncharacterized protein n=1 Tax=Anguilla anguilla TaxID=7936 RepID=A0A0E9Q644_ANGAN
MTKLKALWNPLENFFDELIEAQHHLLLFRIKQQGRQGQAEQV